MNLTYSQSTGLLTGLAMGPATGYSGHPPRVNDPTAEQIHGVGPIPKGDYSIGTPIDHSQLGPFAIPLSAKSGTETFGRSGFYIHGDSISAPGSASHGCVILARAVRDAIVAGGFDTLTVIG